MFITCFVHLFIICRVCLFVLVFTLFSSSFYRIYFIGIALSGAFAVTFSIVFAYVADCTSENERSYSYGLVGLKDHLIICFHGNCLSSGLRNICCQSSNQPCPWYLDLFIHRGAEPSSATGYSYHYLQFVLYCIHRT